MSKFRFVHAAAAAFVLALATPVLASPLLTKATVRRTKAGDVVLNARGELDAADFDGGATIHIGVGSRREGLPLDGFRLNEKRRRYVWKGAKTALVRRAVFDLKKGVFLLKCRSPVAEDYDDPLDVSLELAFAWSFALPVDTERRKTRIRFDVPGSAETHADALVAQLLSGEEVALVLTVRDALTRAVDLRVEYSVDGGAVWETATQRVDEAPPLGVTAPPEGKQVSFTWRAYEDLGCSHHDTVRVRALPLSPVGAATASDSVALTTYGEIGVHDLHADLLADMDPDGTLDGFVLIDTRSQGDFDAGHIPGAIFVAYGDILDQGAAALPFASDFRMVFYCYGGT